MIPVESGESKLKMGSEEGDCSEDTFCPALSHEKISQEQRARQKGNRNSFIRIKSELPQTG